MKLLFPILLIFFFSVANAQKKKSTTLGKGTMKELQMNTYIKDSSANALVLYEHANLYTDKNRNYDFTTDYYYRIKIFNKAGRDKATVKIPVYKSKSVHNIKAITYNIINGKIEKKYLLDEQIFENRVSEHLKEISFTLPNIKEGSVIEYTYSVTSPYSKIRDWYFQSDIPKIKSDFTSSILGNWKYNIRLIGNLKLTRDKPSIEKKCIKTPGLKVGACINLDYSMDSIPAFEEESYMLSKRNYISRLSFDLQSFTGSNGSVKNFTKTWKVADKKLKNDFLDNQISKEKFFKRKLLPDSVSTIKNELDKSKLVFDLIKKHYTWNGEFWPSQQVKVKEAFEKKTGNIFDINLSLYNTLKAANVNAKIMLLATRAKGLPTKLHPIYNDFNYLIVKVIINNKAYLLDATDKNMPFGLIRYKALNSYGRIMDFEKGSYWEDIKVHIKSSNVTKLELILADDVISGNLIIDKSGYSALNRRNAIGEFKDEDIIESFEEKYPDIEVEEYSNRNLERVNKNLIEYYKIIISDIDDETIKLNPFIVDRLTQNPFKLNKRNYPVDYGYARKNSYLFSLKIPKGYVIKKLPENKVFSLPNKGGRFILNVKNNNNTIILYCRMTLNKKNILQKIIFI